MSDDRTKLRKYADAGRPLIEQWLDIGEEFKAIRDAARNDGIDWASVKALIKAEILDSREDTDKRVKAIIEKADFARAYADMLGMSNNLSAKRKTRDDAAQSSGNSGQLPDWDDLRAVAPDATGDLSSEDFVRELRDGWREPEGLHTAPEKPADAIEPAAVTANHNPAGVPSDARYAIPDDLSVPAFLDRRPKQEAAS